MPAIATGYHDMHGIPVHVGDLVRSKHYVHRRGRRQMWLYFRVAINPTSKSESDHGRYVVQNWGDLDPTKWQCLLRDCGIEGCEVLAGQGLQRNERGEILTFNERPRKNPRG